MFAALNIWWFPQKSVQSSVLSSAENNSLCGIKEKKWWVNSWDEHSGWEDKCNQSYRQTPQLQNCQGKRQHGGGNTVWLTSTFVKCRAEARPHFHKDIIMQAKIMYSSDQIWHPCSGVRPLKRALIPATTTICCIIVCRDFPWTKLTPSDILFWDQHTKNYYVHYCVQQNTIKSTRLRS